VLAWVERRSQKVPRGELFIIALWNVAPPQVADASERGHYLSLEPCKSSRWATRMSVSGSGGRSPDSRSTRRAEPRLLTSATTVSARRSPVPSYQSAFTESDVGIVSISLTSRFEQTLRK